MLQFCKLTKNREPPEKWVIIQPLRSKIGLWFYDSHKVAFSFMFAFDPPHLTEPRLYLWTTVAKCVNLKKKKILFQFYDNYVCVYSYNRDWGSGSVYWCLGECRQSHVLWVRPTCWCGQHDASVWGRETNHRFVVLSVYLCVTKQA